MAVPRFGRISARLKARFHVQVQLVGHPGAESPTPAAAPVTGRVVRIFRGDSALRVGDEVRFSVHVCREGDLPWLGPVFRGYHDFMRATHIEAYLNGDPPDCEVALSEWGFVDGPTRFARVRASRLGYLVAYLDFKFG